MLSIYFGQMDEAIYNTSTFFKNVYLDEWFEDPFVIKMIKSVDKAEVLGPNAIKTKALGVVSPTKLSGGLKALMLMYYYPNKIMNASNCGDNCAKWILQIAQKKDITINLRHIMDFGDRKFDVKVLNSQKEVFNMGELAEEAVMFI